MICRIIWRARPGRRGAFCARKQPTASKGQSLRPQHLRANGYPPLIIDFEAKRDTDHVLAVYQIDGCWGAIAKSNFTGLRYREPVYRSLRELALSYFEDYFNLLGERTLRRYSAQVNLKRFDHLDWMTTEKPVWFIAEYLTKIHHFPLISKSQIKRLHRVDEHSLQAGLVGHSEK